MKMNILKPQAMKDLRFRFYSWLWYTSEVEKLERNDSKINLPILLKAAATKKLRLRAWAYSVGEYLYILSRNGLTLRHRTYTANQGNKDFLE